MAPSPPGVVFSTGPESTTPRPPAGCVPMTLGGVPVAGSAGGWEMFRTHVAIVACTLSPMAKVPVGAVTVTAAVPVFPSLVAVIVADPAPAAVTNPLLETVATEPLLVDQVTGRPLRMLPFASFVVAVSWAVCPTVRLAVAGLTVTDATGVLETVTLAVPVFPSLVAVIVAVPAFPAVTNPVPLTLATLPLSLDHVTVRPVRTLPFASVRVAVSCEVCQIWRLTDAGLIVTVATGAAHVTLTLAEAVRLPGVLVAVTVNWPQLPL